MRASIAPPANRARPFLEEVYLAAFSDVASAVQEGVHRSAKQHFVRCGFDEDRLSHDLYIKAYDSSESDACDIECSLEIVQSTSLGYFVLAGWALDAVLPFCQIEIFDEFGDLLFQEKLTRYMRNDVAGAKGVPIFYPYGFFAAGSLIASKVQTFWYRFVAGDGRSSRRQIGELSIISAKAYREAILFYLSATRQMEGGDLEMVKALNRGVGRRLVDINTNLIELASQNTIVQCFGKQTAKPFLSFVVCLFGKVEFLFVQATLFCSASDTASEFEFIYVLNSPEQSEKLVNEAKLASLIYGLSIRIVIMPENVGFGAATNEGVRVAKADQIVVLNPDVFPVYGDWWEKYKSIVARLPLDQTQFFGAPLLYDDGSVMHSGMSYRVDDKIAFDPITSKPSIQRLMRVEHDGKGMSFADHHKSSRQVTAITGAFMSINKQLFTDLGGFDKGFLFGHYEDADLCSRARKAGLQIWVHALPFWHLEGKGSTKLPILDTTSLVNRWLFTERWLEDKENLP